MDENKIGVQGHSWGGYQIAYMITKTNLFAAAEAGAPVSNMTSAYGGIRWESGRSRMVQYERGQSRIGGSLWDAQHLHGRSLSIIVEKISYSITCLKHFSNYQKDSATTAWDQS